ncbi:MAG: AAA family ATPase [Ruminococcus sp.]|jgi:cytidylate kinase
MYYVITIARGFGSGGKEIGSKLADRLHIPCYESQILKMASEETGLSEHLFRQVDEKLKGGYLINKLNHMRFPMEVSPTEKKFISNNNLFLIQSRIIQELARSQSCIILGKCADVVLSTFPNVVSVYVDAPEADCVASIMRKLQIPEDEARDLVRKTDRYRSDYYKCYSKGKNWKNPDNYELVLNSAKVGRDRCVDVLEYYVKTKFNLE